MKANVKNILGWATLLGMIMLTTTVPAWAGTVYTKGVAITTTSTQRLAIGAMQRARYSLDTNQSIGCKSQTLTGSSWTTCYARDKDGNSLICGSGDWKFLEVVQAMTESSQIYFRMVSTGASCSNISVYQGSDLLK